MSDRRETTLPEPAQNQPEPTKVGDAPKIDAALRGSRKPLLGSAAILQALKDEREARSAGLHPPVRTPHEDEAA